MGDDEKEAAAVGESAESQPASPQGDPPPAPGNENQKEVAAVGESTESQPASPQDDPPTAPRNENEKGAAVTGEDTMTHGTGTPTQIEKSGAQRNEHRGKGVLVGVEIVLVLVTAILAVVTTILALVTYHEVHENKKTASDLKEKADQLGSHLSDVNTGLLDVRTGLSDVQRGLSDVKGGLSDVHTGIDEIARNLNDPRKSGNGGSRPVSSSPITLPTNPPSKPASSSSIAVDFNCGVTKKGDKWLLPQAEQCYFLTISVRNQEDDIYYRVYPAVEFFRRGDSWECTPAKDHTVPPKSERDIYIDLKPCFLKNQQERRGDIEFVIKTNAREE